MNINKLPITVSQNTNGQYMASARELHRFLEVSSKFADWIKNKISQYGYSENTDYITFSKIIENGGGRSLEYLISVTMAKELCMLENNERGRQARLYFIECERVAREGPLLPATYLDALKALVKSTEEKEQMQVQLGEIRAQLTEAAPKVELYDKFMDGTGTMSISDFAKSIKAGPLKMFEFMRKEKILFENNESCNVPYQEYITRGYFEVKTRTVELRTREKVPVRDKLTSVTRITPRGMQYIAKKWEEKNNVVS